MKDKSRYLGLLFIVLLFISGCSSSGNDDITESITNLDLLNQEKESSNVEKIEVYHFHGTNQCYSCKTMGDYAEETVNTYFADELDSGKIVFGHVNGELPENKELVMKYGATGSSLWIGVYDNNGFHAEQNIQVWYKIKDKEDFQKYLKAIIQKRLNGDLN